MDPFALATTPVKSAMEWAGDYIKRGRYPVPVPFGRKEPEIKDWPAFRIGSEDSGDLGMYFGSGPTNIGIVLGPSGICDVDLDSPEARQLATSFLPATDSVFGRPSSPRSHMLYQPDGPLDPESPPGPSFRHRIYEGLVKRMSRSGLCL